MKIKKRILFFSTACVALLLSGCGGGDGSSSTPYPPGPPPRQSTGSVSLKVDLANHSDTPMNWDLTGTNELSGIVEGIKIDAEGIPPTFPAKDPLAVNDTFSDIFQTDGIPVGPQEFTFTYDNGQGCQGEITKPLTVSAGQTSTVDITYQCGNAPSQVKMKPDTTQRSWGLPRGVQEEFDFVPQHLSLTVKKAQPLIVSISSLNYKKTGYYEKSENFTNDISFNVEVKKPLLAACDCVVHAPSVFTPHKEIAKNYIGNNYESKVSLAPQRLVAQQMLSSSFTLTDFLQHMQMGGYNTMEFSGVQFAVDNSGAGHLTFNNGKSEQSVADILPSSVVFPAYANAMLQIADAQIITQPQALLDSLNGLAKVGLVLDVNQLAEGAHYANVSSLLTTLLDNGVKSIVLQVPADATSNDLHKVLQLAALLNANSGQWQGWVQGTKAQITTLSSAYKPTQLVVDMSADSLQKASLSALLSSYQTLSSEVNGLIVNDTTFQAGDIEKLRKALFLSEYPSS